MKNRGIEAVEYFTHMFKSDQKLKLIIAKEKADKLVESSPSFLKESKNLFFQIEDDNKIIAYYWISYKPRSKKCDLITPIIKKKYLNKACLKKILRVIERDLKKKKMKRVDLHAAKFPEKIISIFKGEGYEITANQMVKEIKNVKKKVEISIVLKKMSLSQYRSFNKYLENTTYPMVHVMGKTKKEAVREMKKTIKRLIPDGFKDKSNFIFNIVDKKSRKKVGTLWLIKIVKGDKIFTFIADILLKEEFRGRGYGKMVMVAVDNFTRTKKISRVQLNVFEYNTVAKKLYTNSGYKRVYLGMCKKL